VRGRRSEVLVEPIEHLAGGVLLSRGNVTVLDNVMPPVASTDGVNFDRQPLPEERAALLAYLRKL
jgi:hypothetical protein